VGAKPLHPPAVVPVPVDRLGINNNKTLLIGEEAETGQFCHRLGIAATTVQGNHQGQTLLARIVLRDVNKKMAPLSLINNLTLLVTRKKANFRLLRPEDPTQKQKKNQCENQDITEIVH